MTRLRDRYRAWRIARWIRTYGYTEAVRLGVKRGWIVEAGDDYIRLGRR